MAALLPYLLNAVYVALLIATAPWLVWQAVRHGKYRSGWSAKLVGLVPARTGNQPCLWMHAVSVGEVNLLAPLIRAWQRTAPDWEIVLSTTTRTGYALARQKYPQLTVFYAPFDFTWAVRRAMQRVRPTCLLLAELELWPNLIAAARQHAARVVVVNGRLSERSFRGYRRVRRWLQPVWRNLDAIAVQNEEYAARFRALGAHASTIYVTGSLKYDGAQTDRRNAATVRLAALAGIELDQPVLLAGSTQEPEEELVVATFKALAERFPRLRLIVVPRHPERFDAVARLLDDSGVSWQRRSELEPRNPDANASSAARVLLVDQVGELGAWWGVATVGFVGGSLGRRGGQNMIEPAAYGCAVCFGPNTHNFRDVVAQLLEHGAARVVHDGHELTAFVEHCLIQPADALALGARAQAHVATQLGATERTVRIVAAVCGPAPIAGQAAA